MSDRLGKHDSATPGTKRGWLLPVIFFLSTSLALLAFNPFKAQTLTPLDLLVSQPGWSGVEPGVKQRHSQRSDILNALLPAWLETRRQLRAGHWPTWNPTSAGGTPLGTPNVSTFTPGFAIFALSPDPARGFAWAIVFNLTVCGLGMFALLKRHGGWLGAGTAAVGLQSCGFTAAWLYWPHMSTGMWLPWLLWAIDRNGRAPGPASSLYIGAFTGLAILGGFPFLAELGLLAGALLTVVHLSDPRSRAGRLSLAGWCLTGVALGFVLAALPLWELAHWIGQFDLSYRQGRGSYLGWEHARQLFPWHAWDHRKVEESMYVGSLGLLGAAAGMSLVLIRWKHQAPLVRFLPLLAIVSALLVFGLVPVGLVGWIPGMAFNSWSRGIFLLDLALLGLAAIAIGAAWHWSLARKRRLPIVLGLVALCIAQVIDMGGYFQRYNGSVARHFFYPSTPLTDRLQSQAGPFDHVLADQGHLHGGTLGAYGLSEWHAHQFHRDGARRLLEALVEDPFVSRTAARFPARSIRWESPYFDDLNIRYVLAQEPGAGTAIPSPPNTSGRHALPALPGHAWQQNFSLEGAARLQAISVRMATHHQQDLPGTIRMCLLPFRVSPRCTLSKASSVIDNAFHRFDLPTPVDLKPGAHAFTLEYLEGPDTVPLTAWAWSKALPGQALRIDGRADAGALEFQLLPPVPARGRFEPVMQWNGIVLYENRHSPRGPYVLDDLSDSPTRDSGRGVQLRDYRPDRIELSVEAGTDGWLVVPMRWLAGWRGFVDGAEVSPTLKDDVMPAFRVKGPMHVELRYIPVSAGMFLPWLALISTLLITLAIMAARRQGRRRTAANATAAEHSIGQI